ncbi:V0D/AC39 family V-type ATPase subunit [Breznakiella homolactica]|uniref:V-type ATPase subunit n=1 Tax=Breznakiella homolactica TaxID=2798577 RepID=A0A7T8BCK7_9SPIR|nr:V-type ATPase subunit [Breznakiella homolactica]QQO11225.1 V-type ATPase subunit [Breznakiella homolactica]
MPGSGERAYAYAKACGIIGKSFIGSRVSRLNSVSRLSELDRLIFPDSSKDLPERELLPDLEHRIINRSSDQIVAIVSSFPKPPELLARLIRSYEYADLKAVLISLSTGEPAAPELTDIGRFRTIHFGSYPDLQLMLKGTEFEWIAKETQGNPDEAGNILIQMRLDQQYYTLLWASLMKTRKKDREAAEKILSEEISLRNVVWALRLRTYYGMSGDDIKKWLVAIKPGKGRRTLADDAAASLTKALDSHSDWLGWKRAAFLNPEQPGENWKADPRYVQNAAAAYLYGLARSYFRRRPFSLDAVSCFIKLKQFEEDLLTSVAEGLSLGISPRDVISMLEMKP